MLFPYQKDKWKWQGRQYPQSPSLMPPTIGHVGEGDEWKAQWQYPDSHITSESGPLQQSPALPGMVPRTSQTPFYEYEAAHSTSPVVAPRTPIAKKKGLGINDYLDAFGELKPYTPKPGSASARGVGSNTLAKFTPIPGLNPNYDWSYGGLDFDPLKRQKKMMGSLV